VKLAGRLAPLVGQPGQARRHGTGFTLLELLLVMALLAVAVGMVSLSLRDSSAQRLEEEGTRLAALLEGARARSRAMGRELRWQPLADAPGFQFQGLPQGQTMPSNWLDANTRAQVVGAPVLRLGPEPLIDAQQVLLTLGEQRLLLATDGLGPFAPVDGAPEIRQ
jgi:general secretion pathway protein H